MEKLDKKKAIWAVLFIFIAGFSIWAVISQNKSFSLSAFWDYIRNANPALMILATVTAFGFIFFEGEAILVILKAFGYQKRRSSGMLYSAADIYFSAITPSATGGQPASAYFMVKEGIPTAAVTITLLLNLVMYTTALMAVAVIAAVFGFSIFRGFSTLSKVFIIIGFALQNALTVLFIILINNRKLTQKLCDGFLRLLRKLHLMRHYDERKAKLQKTMDEYQECAHMIATHKSMIIKGFLLNFGQRVCNVSVSAIVFLAGGGAFGEAFKIWLTQSFVAVGANSVPIPGSMGVTDYLMLDGFSQFMDGNEATQLELLSRSLSFYVCIFVCSISCLIGYIIINKKRNHTS